MGQECKGRVPGILILTHGRAGIELIESSKMILGEMEEFTEKPYYQA